MSRPTDTSQTSNSNGNGNSATNDEVVLGSPQGGGDFAPSEADSHGIDPNDAGGSGIV